jgi:hypothetical protein
VLQLGIWGSSCLKPWVLLCIFYGFIHGVVRGGVIIPSAIHFADVMSFFFFFFFCMSCNATVDKERLCNLVSRQARDNQTTTTRRVAFIFPFNSHDRSHSISYIPSPSLITSHQFPRHFLKVIPATQFPPAPDPVFSLHTQCHGSPSPSHHPLRPTSSSHQD